ncbi:MAG: long-chain fatty acid--CoA ligase [Marinilabiliales bacterium]|nr:MAG: long-chain fatty acid--CoA ligase [Marinilabiliales bacterium]
MKNIPELFKESAERFPGNPLILEKYEGSFQALNYKNAYTEVKEFAAALKDIGMKPDDKVVLYAEGRTWWLLSELAVLFNRAVSVPVSIRLEEPDDLLFRVTHSESKFIICSIKRLGTIRKIVPRIDAAIQIIVLDIPNKDDKPDLQKNEILLSELLSRNTNTFPEEELSTISPDTPANICYTSGTTADPKGIILSHGNYLANVNQAGGLFEITPDFTTLLILPWDHSFAHTVGLYTLIANGGSMAAVDGGKSPVEAIRNIPKNIKEIRPYFLLSVPALAKNFKANIEKGVAEKGSFVKMLFKAGLAIGRTHNGIGVNRGKGLRFLLKPLYFIFDSIVFKKIRANFGGRLRYFVGGGALLDIELQKFFAAIGIPMYQGYGLTEAAPVISSNNPSAQKMGSSGRIAPNMEVRIADEDDNELPAGQKGEILVQGKNVMQGYWRNAEATAETLKNGWLHTGDLGYFDQDGYLYVQGRFKSLLISDDGEKYSPEALEEAMIFHSDIIDQIMLHNNQNPYTTALICLNAEKLKKMLHERAGGEMTDEALELVRKEVNKIRHDHHLSEEFPVRWLPSSFAILEEGFNEQNKFINSTLKMVRPKITEHYKDLIDSMYHKEGKKEIEVHNKSVLAKLLT